MAKAKTPDEGKIGRADYEADKYGAVKTFVESLGAGLKPRAYPDTVFAELKKSGIGFSESTVSQYCARARNELGWVRGRATNGTATGKPKGAIDTATVQRAGRLIRSLRAARVGLDTVEAVAALLDTVSLSEVKNLWVMLDMVETFGGFDKFSVLYDPPAVEPPAV